VQRLDLDVVVQPLELLGIEMPRRPVVRMDNEFQLDTDPSGRAVLETGSRDPALGFGLGDRLPVHQSFHLGYVFA
jgi:hypothetical protein